MSEIPELPEWIKALIDSVKEKAHLDGFREGYAHAMSQVKDFAGRSYYR